MRVKQTIILTVVCAIVVIPCVFYLHYPPYSLKDPAKLREVWNGCFSRMSEIGDRLRNYARENSDFPRTTDGRFAPNILVCQDGEAERTCIPISKCCCSLHIANPNQLWDGFVWCTEPNRQQVTAFMRGTKHEKFAKPSGDEWVILCHDPVSAHRFRKINCAMALLSSGDVVNCDCDDNYVSWFNNIFRNGDLRIPTFMLDRLRKDRGL